MARPSTSYEPRRPAGSVLHQIVRDHLESFLVQAARLRDGDGLPQFVERAVREFLRCRFLAGGFARPHCGECGLDRLVAFSCKGRALCPSCGGRRMAERAAHLVDHVLPDVPVRQWVLSLPYRLRYRLAWDHDLCRRVTAVFLRAVFRLLSGQGRAAGLTRPRGGAVAVIQRFPPTAHSPRHGGPGFGGALNLNIHIHALVLDGVFARDAAGAVAFHAAPRLTTLDVAEVLAAVEPRLRRLLDCGELAERDHWASAEDGGVDRWADETPVLAGLAAASVKGLVALGRDPGTCLRRLGHSREAGETPSLGPCHVRWNGLDLHAGLVVPAGQRERLERVCRYTLRPPVTPERLAVTAEGEVRLALRHPWGDGTTHVVFDPVEFLGRLAGLVPRPRVNLILYYGVLGARAVWRPEVVPRRTSAQDPATGDPVAEACRAATPDTAQRRARGHRWADLMRRTFGFDVLACPRCDSRLRLIALIEEVAVIGRILRHLGLPSDLPVAHPARAPPLLTAADEAQVDCDDAAP